MKTIVIDGVEYAPKEQPLYLGGIRKGDWVEDEKGRHHRVMMVENGDFRIASEDYDWYRCKDGFYVPDGEITGKRIVKKIESPFDIKVRIGCLEGRVRFGTINWFYLLPPEVEYGGCLGEELDACLILYSMLDKSTLRKVDRVIFEQKLRLHPLEIFEQMGQ